MAGIASPSVPVAQISRDPVEPDRPVLIPFADLLETLTRGIAGLTEVSPQRLRTRAGGMGSFRGVDPKGVGAGFARQKRRAQALPRQVDRQRQGKAA